MKRNQLLVLSALVAGLQIAVAQASPFPADAEASHDLVALESYAERQARTDNGAERMVIAGFPADAEASNDLPGSDSYAERQARTGGEVWGVSPRQPHDPFPFNSGYITD